MIHPESTILIHLNKTNTINAFCDGVYHLHSWSVKFYFTPRLYQKTKHASITAQNRWCEKCLENIADLDYINAAEL